MSRRATRRCRVVAKGIRPAGSRVQCGSASGERVACCASVLSPGRKHAALRALTVCGGSKRGALKVLHIDRPCGEVCGEVLHRNGRFSAF